MSTRLIRRLSLVVALVLLISAFAVAVANAASEPSTNITITETEFKLDPAQITVPLNTPVHFTVKNAGAVAHNLEFELSSASMQQALFATNLNPGETRTGTFTFTRAGSWVMFCPVDGHANAGMKGTVMVLAAQAATQAPKTSAAPSAAQSTMSSATASAAQTTKPAAASSTAASSTKQSTAPKVLPRTGGSDALALWVLAGAGLFALGVVFRFAQRPARP